MVFAALIVAVLVAKVWPVLVAIIGMTVGAYWTRRAVDRHAERVEAERRRVAGLVARCDEQHAWLCADDERGLYGEFPPDPRVGEFPAAAT